MLCEVITQKRIPIQIDVLEIAAFIKNRFHRRAYWLICAMDTAQPTTWPARPLLKLTNCPFNMLLSGFFFFDKDNPAYPFVARKWREALPHRKSLGVRN